MTHETCVIAGRGERPSVSDSGSHIRARQQHGLQAALPNPDRLRHPKLPVRATQSARLLPLNGHHAQVPISETRQIFYLTSCLVNTEPTTRI